MRQYLVFALVFVTVLVLISGHPVEDQKVTLEDAEAQPGVGMLLLSGFMHRSFD